MQAPSSGNQSAGMVGEVWKDAVLVRTTPRLTTGDITEKSPLPSGDLPAFRQAIMTVAEAFDAPVQPTEDGGMLLIFLRADVPFDHLVMRAVEAAESIKSSLTGQTIQTHDSSTAEPSGSEAPTMSACLAIYPARVLDAGSDGNSVILTAVDHEGMELVRLCPPGEICMSQSVQRIVQSRYTDRPLGVIGRGDSHRTGAYVLGLPRPHLPGGVAPQPLGGTLAGRERELERLKQTWTHVARGEGSRIVTLLAPPAMGRTHLLEAFLSSLDQETATFVVASCEDATALAPYYPFVDIVTQLIGATRDDDDDTVALRLMLKTRDAIAASAGWEVTREHEPDIIELSTVLGELLGIDMASRERYLEPSTLSPEELRQRTFYCVMKFLRDVSTGVPLVLSIENIHLADSATLDLIAYLGKMLRGSGRVLLICSGDASFVDLHQDWGENWSNHDLLRVERLTDEAIEGAVRTTLEGAGDDLVRSIVRQARGRPGIATLTAEAWTEWQAAEQSSLVLETLDDQDETTTVTSGSRSKAEGVEQGGNGADRAPVSSGPSEESAEDLVDVTDSLRTAAEHELGSEDGGSAPPPAQSREPVGEHWRALAPEPDPNEVSDAGETFPGEDDPGVDYFFENPETADEGLKEGSSFVMAYRDEAADGEEDGAPEASGIDDLFLSAPDPLGPLQHLLPGEIWARRLDRLEDSARRVLTLASISGRSFRGEQVVSQWRMDGGEPDVLPSLLEALQQAGFLERRLEARCWQVSWRFRSTLLQQIVYDGTPLAERHRLHRQLARLLIEDQVGGRTRATYALVGYHFDRGDDPDRAFRYYVLAGKKARRTMALREAEQLISRARTLMKETGYPDGGTETIGVHQLLGEVLALLNEPKRAIAELETALEFARLRGEAKRHCEVLMSLCDVLDGHGDQRRALEVAQQAHRAARTSSAPRLVVQSLRRLGWEYVRSGRLDEARRTMEQAVDTALATNDPDLLVTAFDALGGFHYVTGNYGLATRGYENLLEAIKASVRHRGPGSAFPDASRPPPE